MRPSVLLPAIGREADACEAEDQHIAHVEVLGLVHNGAGPRRPVKEQRSLTARYARAVGLDPRGYGHRRRSGAPGYL